MRAFFGGERNGTGRRGAPKLGGRVSRPQRMEVHWGAPHIPPLAPFPPCASLREGPDPVGAWQDLAGTWPAPERRTPIQCGGGR